MFALSGALLGIRVRFDIVGVIVLAVITGIGGGIIRDVLIGDIPPASFKDWRYFVGARGRRPGWPSGSIPGCGRIERYIDWFDAVGLGLFCVHRLRARRSFFGLEPVPAA